MGKISNIESSTVEDYTEYGERLVILLMGVSGSGKTTVGKLLAWELGWQFADEDDYHPTANVARLTLSKTGKPATE